MEEREEMRNWIKKLLGRQESPADYPVVTMQQAGWHPKWDAVFAAAKEKREGRQ
jgi:hypothetical protein